VEAVEKEFINREMDTPNNNNMTIMITCIMVEELTPARCLYPSRQALEDLAQTM
jgi:hypothetical protein